MSVINFYSLRGPYAGFSNFSAHRVVMNGLTFPTSEHYFQAMKFEGTEYFEKVRQQKTPKAAAQMGRDRSLPLRKDWDTIKDSIMHNVVKAKFVQHKELTATLLSTGDTTLVEHTKNDSYWGDAGDGSGKNMLGKTLMAVREEICEEARSSDRTKALHTDTMDAVESPKAKRVKK